MNIRFFIFGALLVSFVPAANAQQVYKWRDQKGQWHFSNAPSSGAKAEKVKGLDLRPRADPPTSQGTSPGNDKGIETTAPEVSKGRSSALAKKTNTSRWLFLLSNNKILQVFDSSVACEQYMNLLISRIGLGPRESSETGETGKVSEKGDAKAFDLYKEGRCVPSDAMELSTKKADVVVISMRLVRDPARVAHYVLSGTVINRGQSKATNVSVHYQIRRVGGMKVGKGKVSAIPRDIPGGGVGVYRGLIVGIPGIDARYLQTEVHWSKD